MVPESVMAIALIPSLKGLSVPVTSVPMKLACTRFCMTVPDTPLVGPMISTPFRMLPERTFRTAADAPPMMLLNDPPMRTPCVRTGSGAIWNNEEAYLQAAGVSKSGTLWVAERGVVAVGADNMGWDVLTERDPESGTTLFAHYYLLPQKGIYIMENLNLEELARDRCYEFAFVGVPLKFTGATGSPLRPLALV